METLNSMLYLLSYNSEVTTHALGVLSSYKACLRFFPVAFSEKKRDGKNDGKSDHRRITKHGAFMERIVQNFPALKS